MVQLTVIDWSRLATAEQQRILQRPVFRNPGLGNSVAEILRRVRAGGDAALKELTRERKRRPWYHFASRTRYYAKHYGEDPEK